MNNRWIRVILGALLLEVVLFVTLVPLSFISQTVFLVGVPIGAFVFSYLVTRWMLRKVTSGRVVEGTLIGILATAMYFGLVFASPDGLAGAVAIYGAPLFYLCQALRIAGCVAAAMHQPRAAGAPARV